MRKSPSEGSSAAWAGALAADSFLPARLTSDGSMGKKLPAIQFYTGDWLKDPALSMCSASTRGIWVDLVCRMHESDRTGKLRGTMEQLSRLARCTSEELERALDELDVTKTAQISRTSEFVTIINRRMSREHNTRKRATLRQRGCRSSRGVTQESRLPSSSSSSDTPSPPLPESLADEHLTVMWQSFVRHRRELRKPLTPEAAKRTITKLEAWGIQRSIAALEHSIANGWQGVFEPDAARGNGSRQPKGPELDPVKAQEWRP